MKSYTLDELKKKYAEINKKKGYRGWYESTKKDAGNVPLNNAIFNMAMGSSKSVDMAQVNADSFVGDAPTSPTTAPTVATPDGGIGMVGMAEDISNEPLTLKVTFNDGDYLVTQYEGTFKNAKDHFIGNTIKWEDEKDEKKGVDVKLLPMTALPRNKTSRIQEDMNVDKVTTAIKSLGSLTGLTAEDWIALRDDPKLDSIKDDLWMYGNEIRALMDYVFMDGQSYNAGEILQDYRGAIGVSVTKVLKELRDMEYQDRRGGVSNHTVKDRNMQEGRNWKEKIVLTKGGGGKIIKMQNISPTQNDQDYYILLDDKGEYVDRSLDFNYLKSKLFNNLTEGFNGDEHALIERISNLREGEVLRLKNSHNDISLEQPLTICIKKNSKFPGRYMLWDETEDGERLNEINFSSLDNAVEWAKQTDEFLTESKKRK